MPFYSYKLINGRGEVETGTRHAKGEEVIVEALQRKGCIPLELKEIREPGWLALKGSRKSQRMNLRQLLLFTSELTVLVQSGLPLDQSLLIVAQLTEQDEQLNTQVLQLVDDINTGLPLSEAMGNQPESFNSFYLSMVKAGEMGGDLGGSLNSLTGHLKKTQEIKQTVVSAIIYPVILVIMSVISMAVMLVFVVPQFKQMFENADQALPVLTQIVLAVADATLRYGWIMVPFVMVLVGVIGMQLKDPKGQARWERRLLKTPLLGEIIINKEVAAFSRSLETLLVNGVHIDKALRLVRDTVSHSLMADLVKQTIGQLKEGGKLSETLMASDWFPIMAGQLIRVGEETGNLDEMLSRVAELYENEVQIAIQRLLSILEPLLIVVLGLIIGTIIVSILLAILSVNDLAF
ncbi:MAG TPA: type II secretion system F family protein [Methylococcales bacterium]|nr:type II secretion system F family protein [Methylococcales bacterium]